MNEHAFWVSRGALFQLEGTAVQGPQGGLCPTDFRKSKEASVAGVNEKGPEGHWGTRLRTLTLLRVKWELCRVWGKRMNGCDLLPSFPPYLWSLVQGFSNTALLTF